MRPQTKFLTAVWGEAYVERFASLSLPSFLAPGNLPALAAATELEVLIMTAARDVPYFERHAAFRKLRTTCPVRFIAIDDLIVGAVYGVTLTLAYARAIVDSGAAMVGRHFVFMNADFVLADGSLASLAQHIAAGRSIVLAPSFRASAEPLEPALRAAVDPAATTLAMPARDMLKLAMAHPHPTTIAKTVTQSLCHSVHPNQLFWQVDSATLLARYYLIFMLCLRPERPLQGVDAFCDYGFVPALCPSGDTVVMDDSDAFLMLELQRRSQELFYLRFGPQSDADIAASLSEWTTGEHRRNAEHDIVFHIGEVPPRLAEVKAQASARIRRIAERLGPTLPHAGHPYWVGSLRIFGRLHAARGHAALPAELATGAASGAAAPPVKSFLADWYTRLLGDPPLVTPLNPHWLDYRHLGDTIASITRQAGARLLVIREMPELVDPLFAPDAPVEFASLSDARSGELRAPVGRITHVLIYVQHPEARHLQAVVLACRKVLEPGTQCVAFLHKRRGEIHPDDLMAESLAYLEGEVGATGHSAMRSSVGSWFKRFNGELFTALGEHYKRYGVIALLWVAPALLALAPSVAATNLLLRHQSRHGKPRRGYSSVAIDLGTLSR